MENLGLGIAVLGIVNGMIGGASLVIPLLALHAGYLLILPITILFGGFSLYSCLLMIRHLG